MDISKVILLDKNEYEKYKNSIRAMGEFWWLRSSANYTKIDGSVKDNHVNVVDCYDDIQVSHPRSTSGVRPALVIHDHNQKVGDRIKLFGYTWTVIDNSLVLCDSLVAWRSFDDKNGDWETSDIKDWLERWLSKKQCPKAYSISPSRTIQILKKTLAAYEHELSHIAFENYGVMHEVLLEELEITEEEYMYILGK